MKKNLRYIVFVAASVLAFASCIQEYPEIPLPKIDFKGTVSPEFDSADINVTVSGNFTPTALTVEYSKDRGFKDYQSKRLSSYQNNVFSTTLTQLEVETQYYYRYILENNYSKYTDNTVRNFKTKDYQAPQVTTGEVSTVLTTTARLGGSVENKYGKAITVRGFRVGENKNKLTDYPVASKESYFYLNISDLKPGTKYYYQAFATSGAGTGTGEIKDFTTISGLAELGSTFVTNIKATSADFSSSITNYNGGTIQECGFCYGTSNNPTTDNFKVLSDYKNDILTATASPLAGSTHYYVRSFARTEYGTTYGAEKEFTTPSAIEAVNLGLSVKWGSCNVGASSPEDYGDYYAWGETAAKSSYSWTNYSWCNGSSTTLTKYNCNSSYGTVDNKTVLEQNDDAAHVKLGDSWRMPTDAEWTELREKCTWIWTTKNGVNGRLVKGPNGNSIFLPAAGYWGSAAGNAGTYGRYWSSSLCTDSPYNTWCVYFYSDNVTRTYYNRYYGRSVRPVYGDFVAVSSISLNSSSVSLEVGKSYQLSATISPTKATEKTVRWVTSNSSVATVSDNGLVTAKSLGSATITAYASSGKSATCNVVVNGHEAVDLGLSVMWASCNVGASSPEGYGDYYAWGETSAKSSYSWSNYAWCNGSSSTLTKYNCNNSYGTVDNKTVLEQNDDAAHVKWGDSWRMPTDAEWTELREKCTWTWTTKNGVSGRLVKGPNGNSIFLPAAGYRSGTYLDDSSYVGRYWSSSLCTDSPNNTWCVYFYPDNVTRNYYNRSYGRSVRPVYGAFVAVSSIYLNSSSFSLNVGTNYQLSATVYPSNATEKAVRWVTSNSSVATVSDTGMVTAQSVGSATITVYASNGKSASCSVTVTVPVTGVSLNKTALTLDVGTSETLTATVSPNNASNKDVTWSSSNSNVASVDAQGKVTAKKTGNATITVTTKDGNKTASCNVTVKEAPPQYVDLGLSVKWAAFNLGASKPEEYGDFFAWGETDSKVDYTWSSYKLCNKSVKTLSKYNFDKDFGVVDHKTVLEPGDDAAHVHLGDKWRMPTKAEIDELWDKANCTRQWVSSYNYTGISGYLFTSLKTNKSIFLPSAGYRNGAVWTDPGSTGDYWTSSLYITSPDCAYYLYSGTNNTYLDKGRQRIIGLPIRPVYGDFITVSSVSVDRQKANLTVKQSIKLSATVYPGNATEKTVHWGSSNSDIAEVSSDGTVTAKAIGTAVISAYGSNGKYASCTVDISDNAHEAVDLGLSVKWATCNVGATSPEDSGNYFAWGEPETKTVFEWSNYLWCNGTSTSMTKYNTKDNISLLEASDDAAYRKWGENWRMPTWKEMLELFNDENCEWVWSYNGFLVTSKKTNKSIFFPVQYDEVSYWTATRSGSSAKAAQCVKFLSGDKVDARTTKERFEGLLIRPVTDK